MTPQTCRLKQLANAAGNEEFRVCVIEKAAAVGGHILSGACLEPRYRALHCTALHCIALYCTALQGAERAYP